MSGAVAQLVEGLRIRGGLKGSDLANITHVSQATVSDLRYDVDRLAELYSPDQTRMCLYARNPLLDGSPVIGLIRDGGADGVLAVIDSLSEAIFTSPCAAPFGGTIDSCWTPWNRHWIWRHDAPKKPLANF
jgi:hypothetical protein